jgi:eukaryotic-like serine/threonine-protein kinase
MTGEQWQQVKEIFGRALERPDTEREEFLRQACGGDPGLIAEVDSLLKSYATTASPALVPRPIIPDNEFAEGRMLGAYRILREIGRGGMAAVYLACRADDAYQKRVAIKVLDALVASPDSLRRFRTERQTLALLDHPNIVRLRDGGTTEQGSPYLVMDYVQGTPIDNYCDARRSTIAERLGLFQSVCSAVQYAHQSLVVHRDLKPANILVTADGTVKLLDFGIAKLVQHDLLSDQVPTRTNFHPMTPEYASPEQIRGEPVTTATDIYSLGVMLYLLLTGQSPYRLAQPHRLTQLTEAVLNQEPQRPSALVLEASDREQARVRRGESSAEHLSRHLAGDLDNIALMALRKEPQRRYNSVQQFSEDITRYSGRLPVLARQPTLLYRAAKFARRHGAAIAAAVVMVLGLSAAAVISWHEARVAKQQRSLAERRFEDVHQLADSFLFEFEKSIRDLPGSIPARKLVVQKAMQYLNRLASEPNNDPALISDLVKGYIKIGDIQGNPTQANLGDTQGALENYATAERLAQSLWLEQPTDSSARLWASALEMVGAGDSYIGRPEEAVRTIRRAIELLKPVASKEPGDSDIQLALESYYEDLGDAYGHGSVANLGQNDQALEGYHEAQRLLDAVNNLKPADAGVLRRRAVLESKIGDVLLKMGKTEDAVQHHRNFLALCTSLADADPSNSRVQRELSVAQARLAVSLWQDGKRTESLVLQRKAMDIASKLLAQDPTNAQLKFDAAAGDRVLAESLFAIGQPGRGVEYFGRGIQLMSELAEADPENSKRKSQLADGLWSYAHLLALAGQTDRARRATVRSLVLWRALAAAPSANVKDTVSCAIALMEAEPKDLRDVPAALGILERANREHPNNVDILDQLAGAYVAEQRLDLAAQFEQQAYSLLPDTPENQSRRETMAANLKELRKR